MNKLVKEKLKQILTITIILGALIAVLLVMLKYAVEGETNMPFKLDKMLIISSAEAEQKEGLEGANRFDANLNQYTDFYLQLSKNDAIKDQAFIKEIKIYNFKATAPKKGTIDVYTTSGDEKVLFKYNEETLAKDGIVYTGGTETNTKNHIIGNQGGTLIFRVVNRGVAEFKSEENEEIKMDGSILKRAGLSYEDIRFKISFNIKIVTDTEAYEAKVVLELPKENILETGVSQVNYLDNEKVVFKRANT